ncbi:MAG: AIR synthase-related protein [Patescibacteria group bacterium]|nr:AIR synthase-related protein [Patescibacteria group bacterium]
MPTRINIKYRVPDARARAKKKYFQSLGLSGQIQDVAIADSYTIDTKLSEKQIAKAQELLTNPLLEISSLTMPAPEKFSFVAEISFLPGVTDNAGNTAKETLEDGLRIKFKPGENVYSSQAIFVEIKNGKPADWAKDAQTITDSLYNPLIQKAVVLNFNQYQKNNGLPLNLPKVKLGKTPKPVKINLNIPDTELAQLGKQGILNADGTRRGPLSLDLDSLKTIRDYFNRQGRQPTDVELESLAQTWSEHCKHTIFADPLDEVEKGLYKTYIKGATEKIREQKNKHNRDFCVSVFTDNSGAIEFDDDYLITHKVETHNSPSALDPFGGAITGIVGVNRDALGFGLGAKPVINVYGYCLADPRDKTELFRDAEKTQKMLSARRIMEGVVAGVNAGGNQSGIPTNQGTICFDPRYRGKPLVFAGTVGLIPKKIGKKLSHLKKAEPGDYIVMAGGRVGLDGIHGATFSSEALDKGSPAGAVQIGDPITQKKMSDALVKEARQKNLYNSITDDGAGGLSSSVAEMATQSGGCEVWLDKVPLKYPGLSPWQIWISESQERMTLAVPKNKWKEFSALMKRRGVEATIIGKFTNSGKCAVKFGKQKVVDINMEFLHNGRPSKTQHSETIEKKYPDPEISGSPCSAGQWLSLLSQPNIAGFGFISSQYDYEVQGGSVLKPLQGAGLINADASVTRPVLTSKKGVVLAYGLTPAYSDINTYNMAACAIDTAIRAAVAAGANVDYMALLDNFCWCSSNEPEKLYQLKQAAKACYDYATAFGTPFISGKDSMFNDFKGFDNAGCPVKISIPPTLLISAIGIVPDIAKTVSLDAKMPGDYIYLLGETHNELGGSEFLKMSGELGNNAPAVDAEKNLKLYRAFYRAAQQNLAASAISVNKGGLAAALAKALMGGNLGGEINLGKISGSAKADYTMLYSESQGRILATVNPKKAKIFEKLMEGNAFAKIGIVKNSGVITVNGTAGKNFIKLEIKDALEAYRSTFKDY